MTVLEWLDASTRYTFKKSTLEKIAFERGCSVNDDVLDVSLETRNLMEADIIYTAILLSPSSTASLSQSHNGYQKTVGQEQDTYWSTKIKYAIAIYKLYGDPKGDLLSSLQSKIRVVPIEDVVAL